MIRHYSDVARVSLSMKFQLKFIFRLMRPDGSVIFARTAEPRVLIQLPIDLRTADEYERRIRIAERRPMVKREFEDLGEDTFSHQKYTTQWKR
ncbi:unnamed protein product [Meloidogyne enterolobii]|uniref:Uncharacterized protein n=1 Tax=Meloidogyne enterolobii TaxID=390850 RepID=A0ACB1B2V1_MELEN